MSGGAEMLDCVKILARGGVSSNYQGDLWVEQLQKEPKIFGSGICMYIYI